MPVEFRIGEFSRAIGVSPRTVRVYERLGLLPLVPRHGRYRQYGDEHLARAQLVQDLRGAGLRLREIAAILQSGAQGSDPCEEALVRLDQRGRELKSAIERLQVLLANLQDFRGRLEPGSATCALCEAMQASERR